MERREAMELIKELLDSQQLAVLSTQNQGQPFCHLMAFAATEDLHYLLLATTRATRKYANLLADPRVALLVDNRTNQSADFAAASTLTALGTAWELQGRDRQQYLPIYLAKHPYLAEFVSAPDCALLRLKVQKYLLVTRFQEVQEISLDS
jgi:heme iron utilization protein